MPRILMPIKSSVNTREFSSCPTKPSQSVVASRWLAVFSLLSLIVLGLGWELFWAPIGHGMLALKVLPLTWPLAGILKNRMYTYRWVSLLVWVYFTEGVVRATSDQGLSAVLAALQVALCLFLFAACALHVRARLAAAHSESALHR